MTAPSAAKNAYEAYAATTGGKTYDGPMPSWNELPARIRAAWDAAATAARAFDLLPDTLPCPLDVDELFCGAL